MIKSMIIIYLVFSHTIFLSKSYAEARNCYFPDIPSFIKGKTLPTGRAADLSFSDYQTYNPKQAALLLRCAKNLYRNADFKNFDEEMRRRLDRTMAHAWEDHNSGPSSTIDGYITLGGSSKSGADIAMGTFIIGPDKSLVAVGLNLNNLEVVDEDHFSNGVFSGFVFIYNYYSEYKNKIKMQTMENILNSIQDNFGDIYHYKNVYFLRSTINL